MDEPTLIQKFSLLPLGGVQYHPTAGSTNDLAAAWAEAGAADLSVVVAGEQTAGRGRAGRTWYSPAGAALAFSVVIRPKHPQAAAFLLSHLTALGALAVAEALRTPYSLDALIKWPNDVVVARRKLCGVLVEAAWQGSELPYAVIGIGVNVTPRAVPTAVPLIFPATDVSTEAGRPIDRWELLLHILSELVRWRRLIGTETFLDRWSRRLAFLSEPVYILQGDQEILSGRIAGLAPSGALRLITSHGESVIDFGELHLRPAAPPQN